MTWAKTGVEFPDQCADAGLSDAAYRTHHEVICWLCRVDRDDVTDVSVPKSTVRRIAASDEWEHAVKELVAAGFWRDAGDRYVLVHQAEVTSSSLMAQRLKRQRDKEYQRAKRSGGGTTTHGGVASDVVNDVGSDVSGDADYLTTYLRRGTHGEVEDAREEDDHGPVWPKTAAAGGQPAEYPEWCIAPGCDLPARAGSCHTCAEHAREYEPDPMGQP